MNFFTFNIDEVNKISTILEVEPKSFDGGWSWHVKNTETRQAIVLTAYHNAGLSPTSKGVLVSVQTRHGYFELHDCNRFITFEPDEIIFLQSTEEKLSCLILGKQGTCSLFSNINREILTSDFSKLDPAVLLSAMQLSITESILVGD